jgi:LmbE family N-acetylglucosaminyl deacetylase
VLEDIPRPLGRTGPVNDVIAKAVAEFKPTIVYTPSKNDADPDHRAVHNATLVAAAGARTIACYQGSSATVDFRPHRFVSIDGHTETKLRMLECFARSGERPAYLDPGFAIATARAWSRFGHGEHCEPLEVVSDSGEVG